MIRRIPASSLQCILRPACNAILRSHRFLSSSSAAAKAVSERSSTVRAPSFAELTSQDVEFFKTIVGERDVVTDVEDLQVFNTDWMGKFQGRSSIALTPRCTDEVSRILKYCNEKNLAIVPQGGNTGLVGGSIPVHDEVIISTKNMNKIVSLDNKNQVLICEAGCILQALDTHLKEHGFMMPLDVGSQGSCQIGGNIATNAGGNRRIRYGSLHGTVLGLEAVLADGTVLDSLSTLRKDNTGYDLKQLFIGSEGTLGLVTKVAISTPQRPASVQVLMVGCRSFDEVLATVEVARNTLSEIISAVEYQDRQSVEMVLTELKDLARDPLPEEHAFYVLVETHGSVAEHDQEKLELFMETAVTEGCVQDGVVAQDEKQAEGLWRLREKVPMALMKRGRVFRYDLSMPMHTMYALVEDLRAHVAPSFPEAEVVGFGHVLEGSLNLNVSVPKDHDASIASVIQPFIYDWIAGKGGSISAEYGVGTLRSGHLAQAKGAESIVMMRALKNILDPKGILNPYKLLPPS